MEPEGGLEGHPVQPPARGRNPRPSRSEKGLSDFLLNASSIGALATSRNHGFHHHTALTVKKFSFNIQPKFGFLSLEPIMMRPSLWDDGEEMRTFQIF